LFDPGTRRKGKFTATFWFDVFASGDGKGRTMTMYCYPDDITSEY